MSMKRQLIDYGKANGWEQHLDTMGADCWLILVRIPQPGEPRGKPALALSIELDYDTCSRVVYAETIIGTTRLRLTGGKQAIRQTIRKEGWTE
jgi:hypothetical protein